MPLPSEDTPVDIGLSETQVCVAMNSGVKRVNSFDLNLPASAEEIVEIGHVIEDPLPVCVGMNFEEKHVNLFDLNLPSPVEETVEIGPADAVDEPEFGIDVNVVPVSEIDLESANELNLVLESETALEFATDVNVVPESDTAPEFANEINVVSESNTAHEFANVPTSVVVQDSEAAPCANDPTSVVHSALSRVCGPKQTKTYFKF
ncbi:hypothetical protein MIMGU_mgv1a018089mg [Erythranthe guttata]|uniref:Uncharacterized protein n=1 Tax=Erythranthe guttata TaxID=4155 RepID=A0A022R372_ERYGU|nr:hypothetical protein MIMGU_mgv1a018089mg [Erythranthe guttata]